MGHNESKAPPKLKINQNNDYSNINTAGSKPNSSEKANASVSSFKQERDNLDHGKNQNHLPTDNPEIFPDPRVDFRRQEDTHTHSFVLSKKPDFTNQPQGLKLENQSALSSANRLEMQHEISSKEPVIFVTKPQKDKYEEQSLLFPKSQQQGQKDDKQPVLFSTTFTQGQKGDKKPVLFSTTNSQERKDDKKPVLFSTTNSQERKDDKKPALFSTTKSQERKDDKKPNLFSTTQSTRLFSTMPGQLDPLGQDDDNKYALFSTIHPEGQKDNKQSALFSISQPQDLNKDKRPVLFSTTKPENQKGDNKVVLFSPTQPQKQKDDKQPVLVSTTKPGQKYENQHVAFLTGPPLMKPFSSLPQKHKEINQPAMCNTNQLPNTDSVSIAATDNKPMNKITSGNPFLKSNSNGKFAKNMFEISVNDQSLAIPPIRSENVDTMSQIKDAKHKTGVDALVSPNNYSNKDLNDPLCTSYDHLPVEAVKGESSSFRVARIKGSTKDETIKKTLKHVEMIAESLASSGDKNPCKEESVRTEFSDSPSKGRHNQRMLHNCIVKMRNVRDDDKEFVLSLQKEIVAHLRDLELFTSVLKTCPVINSNIYSSCEIIKDNLSGLKTNYEHKNTHKSTDSSASKIDLYKNCESQIPMYSHQENQRKYIYADHDNTNLFVAPNDPNSVTSLVKKESVTENGEITTPLNPFMALLDQLPEYLVEEKQNISLRNTYLYCKICEKSIAFALFNLKEHLSGKNHRSVVEALNKTICVPTKEFPNLTQQSDSSLPNKPTWSGPCAERLPTACQEIKPVNITLPPYYAGVLDLISKSVKEGFHFGVDVFICLLCDSLENDNSKALIHVKTVHKDQLNAVWHLCKTCLIHMYGTNTHFKEHCLTEQHITITKLKNENPLDELTEEKYALDRASVADELDRGSVCSSKSDTSNRSRTRMTAHEILLSIAKDKKVKNIKGPFGLYCQLCRKYDTESAVFSDHLDTKQHTQCYTKLNSRRKHLSFKECSTCEVWLLGNNDIWREHQNLQMHKEFLASASEKNNQDLTNRHDLPKTNSFDTLERSSSESHSTESNSPKPSSPEDLETAVSEPPSLFDESGPHYDFMKTILKKHLEKKPTDVFYGLYCHLCQLYFLDQEPWESHLQSNSHKTRMSSPECAGRMYVSEHDCAQCNIHLICDEQFFSLHLESLAHKAISRIPGRRQQVEESESEEDYSGDEYDSSENEDESEETLGEKQDAQRNSNNVNSRGGKSNKLICVPNGVYFKGFPPDIESKDIAVYFKKYGPLKSCKIYKRLNTGHCVFMNKIDATIVLQKKTVYIKRAPVIVRPLMARPQGVKEQHRLDPLTAHVLRSRQALAATVADKLSEMDRNFTLNQQKVIEIRQDLSATIPGCRVLLFGSQVTGLATGKSDFDIYVDYDGKSFYTDLSYEKQHKIIQHLQYQLTQRGSKFIVKEAILEARVPIIKVVHMKTNTPCDISCRSGLSVENSQLVRVYMELDPRIRWLVVAVKFWMQANGLLDRNAFTSYATVWLVLFSLMRTANPVICPVVTLQKNCKPHTVARWDCRFHRDMKDVFRHFRTFNKQSEIELLASFFQTYATFPFKATVLCPLNGNVLKRKQFESLILPREFGPYVDKIQNCKTAEKLRIQTPICLQDPFDLSHNVTKGVCRTDLDRFKTLCHHSYNMCQNLLAG